MRKYKIKVVYTFTGTVEVMADNKERAKEIVENNFGAVSPTYHSSNNSYQTEGIIDWNCDVHPNKSTIK